VFKLMIVLGKTMVPAHQGLVPRSQARALKAAYATVRPNAVTRVVKA